jgi:hypothetical protein
VQRGRVELREKENLIDAGVQAIADRDVDQTIFASEGDGGFATFFRQGIKARAAASAHDDCEDCLVGCHRLEFSPQR